MKATELILRLGEGDLSTAEEDELRRALYRLFSDDPIDGDRVTFDVKEYISQRFSDLEHDELLGLGDDDHPHYFLADGSRELTGNLSIDTGWTNWNAKMTGMGPEDGTAAHMYIEAQAAGDATVVGLTSYAGNVYIDGGQKGTEELYAESYPGNVLLCTQNPGNVGIGVVPTTKLDVDGNIRVRSGNYIKTDEIRAASTLEGLELRTLGGTVMASWDDDGITTLQSSVGKVLEVQGSNTSLTSIDIYNTDVNIRWRHIVLGSGHAQGGGNYTIYEGTNNRWGLSIVNQDDPPIGFNGLKPNEVDGQVHIYSPNTGSPSLSADQNIALKLESDATTELIFGAEGGSPYAWWIQTKRNSNDGAKYPLKINPLGGEVSIGDVLTVNSGNTNETAVFKSDDNVSLIAIEDDDTTVYISAADDLVSIGSIAFYHDDNLNYDTVNKRFGVLTKTPTAPLDIDGEVLRLRQSKTPGSASASGNQGDFAWDGDYLYICVQADTWKRVGVSTW